jgi:hypothetical protein
MDGKIILQIADKNLYRLLNYLLLVGISIILIITFTQINIINTCDKQTISANTKIKEMQKNFLNDYNYSSEQLAQKTKQIQNREKYELYDLTYKEVYNFILNDKTDEHIYNETQYNCVHFSTEVNNNAEKNGIRCAYVEINFEGNYFLKRSSHALIGFNTIDKGIVYFEPQTDQNVTLEIGKDYWLECVENGEDKGWGWITQNITVYW